MLGFFIAFQHIGSKVIRQNNRYKGKKDKQYEFLNFIKDYHIYTAYFLKILFEHYKNQNQ